MALNICKGINFSAWGSLSGSAASPSTFTPSSNRDTNSQGQPMTGVTPRGDDQTCWNFVPCSKHLVYQHNSAPVDIAVPSPEPPALSQAEEGSEQFLRWSWSSSRQEEWAALGASQPWRHMRSAAPFIRTEKLGLITFNITKNIRIYNFMPLANWPLWLCCNY